MHTITSSPMSKTTLLVMQISPMQTLLLLFIPILSFAQKTDSTYNGIWQQVHREVSTTPLHHRTAVACHNCYYTDLKSPSPAVSLKNTYLKIDAALRQGADFIELDIVDADGEIRIKRKDTQSAHGALLKDVLGYDKLRNSDVMLFLEIKEEKRTSEKFMWTLLNDLKNYGYAKEGRPVVIRAVPEDQREDFLIEAKDLLNNYFDRMRDYVKLSIMLPSQVGNNTAEMTANIERIAQDSLQIVEFNYKTKNLYAHIQRARELGLGVGLWTIPTKDGETFIAAFRDVVDIFNTEINLNVARAAISDNNLLYQHRQIIPDSAETRKGYLVTAVMQLTELEVEENMTYRVIGREKGDDFTLEIHNPGGSQPTVLRFGVKVNRDFKYAFIPLEHLNTDEIYTFIGAYDGDGTINLWVNQSSEYVTTAHTRGKVAILPQAILVGNKTTSSLEPFDLKTVSVQGWGKWKNY